MAYNFYFDEIFHDAKITITDSRVNIFRDSSKDLFNDSYIGVFWGEKAFEYERNRERIESFEQKYRELYTIAPNKELKSQVIGKDKLKWGLMSLDKNAYSYFDDLFKLLEQISPLIQVNAVSKCELLMRNIFDLEQIRKLGGNPDAFIYSLTKFIITYKNGELEHAFYKATKGDVIGLQSTLIRFVEHLIVYIKENSIKRKFKESNTLQELDFLLKEYSFVDDSISKEYSFVYKENFKGLKDYLCEKKIADRKVNIFIDDYKPLVDAANCYSFKKARALVSTASPHIRFADYLCGFYGKMIWALTNDNSIYEKYDKIENIDVDELSRKHLLSVEWFEIDKKTYDLYLKAYQQLIQKQEAYWAARTWSYSDQVVMFYSLLRYFASYGSYEKYKAVSSNMHNEYYNTACCMELEKYYNNAF